MLILDQRINYYSWYFVDIILSNYHYQIHSIIHFLKFAHVSCSLMFTHVCYNWELKRSETFLKRTSEIKGRMTSFEHIKSFPFFFISYDAQLVIHFPYFKISTAPLKLKTKKQYLPSLDKLQNICRSSDTSHQFQLLTSVFFTENQ